MWGPFRILVSVCLGGSRGDTCSENLTLDCDLSVSYDEDAVQLLGMALFMLTDNLNLIGFWDILLY